MVLLGQRVVHDFGTSLAASHAASDQTWWEECYRAAFPTFASMTDHRKDGFHQRLGVDRSVTLHNSKVIRIDEKVRTKDWGDVLLEEISNSTTGAPGWVSKSLWADYIAYAIVPAKRCLLLPVVQLQTAWAKNGAEWKNTYQRIAALNNGYETISWGIPENVLFPAIGSCLRVQWGEEW